MAKLVEFYLTNTGPCTPLGGGDEKQINSFEDLVNYTNSYSSSMPYTIELKCVVKTYDENRHESTNTRHKLGQTASYENHPIIKEEVVDTYKLYVGDKLVYPNAVDKFVREQYASPLDFDVATVEQKPIVFHVRTQTLAGTYDPKTRRPKVNRFVDWNYLDRANGVFVDRKTLRRITEKGHVCRVPISLKRFFTKTR